MGPNAVSLLNSQKAGPELVWVPCSPVLSPMPDPRKALNALEGVNRHNPHSAPGSPQEHRVPVQYPHVSFPATTHMAAGLLAGSLATGAPSQVLAADSSASASLPASHGGAALA